MKFPRNSAVDFCQDLAFDDINVKFSMYVLYPIGKQAIKVLPLPPRGT